MRLAFGLLGAELHLQLIHGLFIKTFPGSKPRHEDRLFFGRLQVESGTGFRPRLPFFDIQSALAKPRCSFLLQAPR